MLNEEHLALIWAIRSRDKGYSVYEIRQKVEARSWKLPMYVEILQQLPYFNRVAERYIDQLFKAGLLATRNGKPYHVRSRLKTTHAFDQFQDLFKISITDSFMSGGRSILANPVFGLPLAENPRWAQLFVAMPFRDDMKPIYTDHILNVTNALKFSCKRADDLFTANSIVSDVWSAIYHAKLLIVDCTGRNPNVFYELGIAHTLGRPTILISQSIDDIPVDIRHLRVIIYQYTPPGMATFETALTETIKTELGV